MGRLTLVCFAALSMAACRAYPPCPPERITVSSPEPAALMTWADLTGRPLPQPSETLRYGPEEAQIVDLWIPDDPGPHPVVLMIHGGCWQKAIADRTLMNYAAEDLRKRGLFVWNIEYRGVDEPGGGYPGTFADVAAAADLLADEGAKFGLRTDRIAVFGHSAGGHLAAWLSTRANLPPDSPLYSAAPLKLDTIVNSGGLADLAASRPVTLESCLADIMDDLTGPASDARADPLSDTSPAELLPAGARLISVNAARDRIAPPALGRDFTARVRETGGDGRTVIVAGGHVELISPGTEAFGVQAGLLEDALIDR